jgi:Transposase DDE domain group 1
MARIVAQVRAHLPKVRILLRADSSFAREELMHWCEENRADYLFRLARNARLLREIENQLAAAAEENGKTGRRARRFKDFAYATLNSWSRMRRVVGKAEWLPPKETKPAGDEDANGQANPRFIVTSLSANECEARYLYEEIYCSRGDMENRIKECQLDLFADRTSAATMRANQLRLYFASMVYILLCALRRIGLRHTRFAGVARSV